MDVRSFQQWRREFRKSARDDRYAVLRDHLHRLCLPDRPERLLEGTILVVQACLAYAGLDGQPAGSLLGMQVYDPGDAADAKYAITFDLHGKAFARLLAAPGLTTLDLADLYGHPWDRYGCCGYGRFWISRTDGSRLTRTQRLRLEQVVTGDLRFDYCDDEIDIWFDDRSAKGSLLVTVQDRFEVD